MKLGILWKSDVEEKIWEREIRNKMVSLGLNETLSMIFTSDKEAKKYTTDDFEVVKLLDPLAEERNALRYSLIPSMVKIYEYNKARENKDVCIFEIGKGFYKKTTFKTYKRYCFISRNKIKKGTLRFLF